MKSKKAIIMLILGAIIAMTGVLLRGSIEKVFECGLLLVGLCLIIAANLVERKYGKLKKND